MSTLKERLSRLKKENDYQSDSELLRNIYKYLYKNASPKVKGCSEDEFVRRTKGSFSSMIDEKRAFDQDFFYPLEKALHTSMVYILEGTGEHMNETDQRGLRYAASTDTVGNYETLINEEVYMEQDEYRCTLLDYMIEYQSRNGFEFFASRNQLPLNEFGTHDRVPLGLDMNHHDGIDLIGTMLKVCRTETMLKYLNGYYLAENGRDPALIGEQFEKDLDALSSLLASNAAIRAALSDCRTISLKKANPAVRSMDGKPLGDSVFVNFFFNLMLEACLRASDPKDENGQVIGDMFAKAIELNEIAMPAILGLGYRHYRLGKYGYVYVDGATCGSIAVPPLAAEGMAASFSKDTMAAYDKLVEQIRGFQERITANSQMAVVGREMRLAKQENPDFYDFYRLMKETGNEAVASWLGEAGKEKDIFRLPAGKQMPITQEATAKQFKDALAVLASIDAVSESALGEGKVYAFPGLTNRTFFVEGDKVTGIAPLKAVVGSRYDNLAEFVASTCLSMPTYFSAGRMVAAVADTLKAYGVTKKEAADAIAAIAKHYLENSKTVNTDDEPGKILVASAHQRAVWLDLYAKEILNLFKYSKRSQCMKMTNHAHARFKQRQKVKNEGEMMRKFTLAIKRGTLLVGGSSQSRTLCFLFDGYKYIVSEDKETLITVFPAKRPSKVNKHHLIDQLRIRQYAAEAALCLGAI